ncbi:DUF6207 family protein [Streptomyces sp. NPDC057545]|uniref:DUF6207 family protein n=1 Tax=Streptomyces sp. NPDC057545 TaxID=3346164 RepID=UPI0036881A58
MSAGAAALHVYGPGAGRASGTGRVGDRAPSYGCSLSGRRTAGTVGAVREGTQIDEQHIAEPGLVVMDITAADEDTLRAVPVPRSSFFAVKTSYSPPAFFRSVLACPLVSRQLPAP